MAAIRHQAAAVTLEPLTGLPPLQKLEADALDHLRGLDRIPPPGITAETLTGHPTDEPPLADPLRLEPLTNLP